REGSGCRAGAAGAPDGGSACVLPCGESLLTVRARTDQRRSGTWEGDANDHRGISDDHRLELGDARRLREHGPRRLLRERGRAARGEGRLRGMPGEDRMSGRRPGQSCRFRRLGRDDRTGAPAAPAAPPGREQLVGRAAPCREGGRGRPRAGVALPPALPGTPAPSALSAAGSTWPPTSSARWPRAEPMDLAPRGSRVRDRLAERGLSLPAVAAPVAAYVPAVATGHHVHTSGQLPFVDGALPLTGKVGAEVTP